MILQIKKTRETIDLEMPQEKAMAIKKHWEDSDIPRDEIIVFSDYHSCRKSEIKEIKIIKEEKEKRIDNMSEQDKLYYKEIREFRELPPEKKFNDPRVKSLFNIEWLCFKKEEDDKYPPKELTDKAREIATEYFKKNPNSLKVPMAEWNKVFKTSQEETEMVGDMTK